MRALVLIMLAPVLLPFMVLKTLLGLHYPRRPRPRAGGLFLRCWLHI